ncbi:hypothetical protein FH972_021827 [Carpinus fangiana]|uniref:Uncharacterized protein n=1 Tax=Carpinus fangiana TaxID=176857 RepID=A0A5N6KQZ9_9ROSI|nr:hypothetical protein FH972_021827 [Carpinus fangiana]
MGLHCKDCLARGLWSRQELHIYKVRQTLLAIGPLTHVGRRWAEGRFVNYHDVTIGCEFASRIIPVGPPASFALGINDPSASSRTADAPKSSKKGEVQKHVKISLWDTAGQEQYASVTRSYFRGASGALLVFDITRRNTFEAATKWLNDLRQIADDGIIVVLVGNKTDLANASTASDAGRDEPNRRQVTREEAEDWCRQNAAMQYVEASAKSGDGVERAFHEVAERIFQNIQAGKYDLNDRRSGVKTAGANARPANAARTVNLTMTENQGEKSRRCC